MIVYLQSDKSFLTSSAIISHEYSEIFGCFNISSLCLFVTVSQIVSIHTFSSQPSTSTPRPFATSVIAELLAVMTGQPQDIASS